MRVISLSSIPPRFPFLEACLQMLADQECVDEVRLYVPRSYKRFPDYDGTLPRVPKGVKVCLLDDDLGPATKVLPATRDFKDQDVQILFCDDDAIYPKGWANRLFSSQAKRATEAVATLGRRVQGYLPGEIPLLKKPAARQIRAQHDLQYRFERLLERFSLARPIRRPIIFPGYIDILFGHGGVVVRPEFFDEEAFDIPAVAWPVDDIWLSAHLARKGIPIYCPWRFTCPTAAGAAKEEPLLDFEHKGDTRQLSNRKAAAICQEKYKIWQPVKSSGS